MADKLVLVNLFWWNIHLFMHCLMRCLLAVSSWFVQRASLTVNIDLSDVINRYTLYSTVPYGRGIWEKESIIGVQWLQKNPNPRVHPTGTVGSRVGIFLSPLNTNLSLTTVPALGKNKKRIAARSAHVDPWRHCNAKMTSPCRVSAKSGFSGSIFMLF